MSKEEIAIEKSSETPGILGKKGIIINLTTCEINFAGSKFILPDVSEKKGPLTNMPKGILWVNTEFKEILTKIVDSLGVSIKSKYESLSEYTMMMPFKTDEDDDFYIRTAIVPGKFVMKYKKWGGLYEKGIKRKTITKDPKTLSTIEAVHNLIGVSKNSSGKLSVEGVYINHAYKKLYTFFSLTSLFFSD